MSTIVVGVDGSSGSQAAPQWAATTARETLAAFQVDPKLIVDELQGLLDGDVAVELLRAATRLKATMLVLGANRHRVSSDN
jgi:nucleotide-binding universal stress UspA family protein